MNLQRSPLVARLFSQISDLDDVPWEEVVQTRTVWLSRGMLRTVATARPKRAVYPTVWDGDELVAGTVAYIIAPSTSNSRWLRIDVLLGDALEASGAKTPGDVASTVMPTLSIGAHASNDERLLTRPGLSSGARREAISCLLDAAERTAKEDGCRSISLPYVDPNDQELTWLLEQRGFVRFPSIWSCAREVDWDDFAGYLDTVGARRRRDIRRERRLVAESGFVLAEEPFTEELAWEFEVLKGHVDAKYHGEEARQPVTDTSYALVLARECGDRIFALTARKDGGLIACSVAISAGDMIIGAMWGGDYDALGSIPVYYELCYYRMVEYAAEHRLRRIEMGPTAYRAKLARGFEPVRSDGWVRVFGPATHQVVADAAAGIDVEAVWLACRDGM